MLQETQLPEVATFSALRRTRCGALFGSWAAEVNPGQKLVNGFKTSG